MVPWSAFRIISFMESLLTDKRFIVLLALCLALLSVIFPKRTCLTGSLQP